MQTVDQLRTIVFRVIKGCQALICVVKTIVRSLRFTLARKEMYEMTLSLILPAILP